MGLSLGEINTLRLMACQLEFLASWADPPEWAIIEAAMELVEHLIDQPEAPASVPRMWASTAAERLRRVADGINSSGEGETKP